MLGEVSSCSSEPPRASQSLAQCKTTSASPRLDIGPTGTTYRG